MSSKRKMATIAVRAALESDKQHGAIVPPLYLSSNFAFAGYGDKPQYDYTRSGNPTRDALADALKDLEGGAGAIVTSSGMAAITLVMQLLKPGDLLIAPHDCYGGTYRLFESLSAKGQFKVCFVDQNNDSALSAAIMLQPRLIWVETPSNPLLRIVDIEQVSKLAKSYNALLVVDNTFLSPGLQQPISLGADIVIHSTTKYLNGHSDVVGGAAIAATDELTEKLNYWANCLGLTGSPFDSYLTMRGLRTLYARLRLHEENTLHLARILDKHSAVRRTYYPGLVDHPGHDIACRQQQGFGGMLSFELKGGQAAVQIFVEHLRYFSLAESLGGVESLVCHPHSMTHAPMSDEALALAGISQDLVRLSVGIESLEDLTTDVLDALEAVISTIN
jgi:cystathionine gamma-synthase